MIFNSFLAMATGYLAAAAPSVNWQSDYSTVRSISATQHKPVMVLFGAGDSLKAVPASTAATLTQNFVCLYADVSTPAGQTLAATFNLSEGVVISDRDGERQALRHAGAVSADELAQYAAKYAQVSAHADHTDLAGSAVAPVPVMQVVAPAPVYAPVAAPVMQYAPAPMFLSSGGCANGRCGR